VFWRLKCDSYHDSLLLRILIRKLVTFHSIRSVILRRHSCVVFNEVASRLPAEFFLVLTPAIHEIRGLFRMTRCSFITDTASNGVPLYIG
jgi:hypothetical protein